MHGVFYTLALLLAVPASVLFVSSNPSALNPTFAGPFDITLKELHQCSDHPENDDVYLGSYKMRKASRTDLKYSGSLISKKFINDSYEAKIVTAIWGNGGWRENYYNLNLGGVCAGLNKYIPKFVQSLKENNDEFDCPLKPGTYEFSDLELALKVETVPALQFAKYKVGFNIWNEKGRAFCFILVVELVPKNKKKWKR